MWFKTSKEIAIVGVYSALLIALQYVLSGIKGVELVTVFLLCFAFSFGSFNGVVCAIVFSLLRCLIFGFFPTVIILYLVYYPVFALFAGLIGKYFQKRNTDRSVVALISSVVFAAVFTALFSLLDVAIVSVFYGYTAQATKAYFAATVPVMIIQCVCAAVSVAVLFYPITTILLRTARRFTFGKIDK